MKYLPNFKKMDFNFHLLIMNSKIFTLLCPLSFDPLLLQSLPPLAIIVQCPLSTATCLLSFACHSLLVVYRQSSLFVLRRLELVAHRLLSVVCHPFVVHRPLPTIPKVPYLLAVTWRSPSTTCHSSSYRALLAICHLVTNKINFII